MSSLRHALRRTKHPETVGYMRLSLAYPWHAADKKCINANSFDEDPLGRNKIYSENLEKKIGVNYDIGGINFYPLPSGSTMPKLYPD